VQGRRDAEARQGFRAAGLHDGLQAGGKRHGENALKLHREGQIIGIFRLALGRVAPSRSLKITEFLMDPTRP